MNERVKETIIDKEATRNWICHTIVDEHNVLAETKKTRRRRKKGEKRETIRK